jgi:mRNA interferase RelE/StbE
LRVLPARFAAQIIRKISRLELGSRGDIKRLQSSDFGYRLSSSDYRVLFDREGDRIIIQRIKHRKHAYD